MQIEARVIAAVVALSAFVIAVVAGLGARLPADVILFRALLSMAACQALGMALGAMVAHVRAEHAARYVKENPIPSVAPVTVGEEIIEVGEESVEKSQ